MKQFLRYSKLVLQPQLSDRWTKLILEHDYHRLYADFRIPPMALEFVESRSLGETQAKIYCDIQVSEISNLDKIALCYIIYWGSYSTRRPDGDLWIGHCQNPLSNGALVKIGRVETLGITEPNIVLAMFSRHYNMDSTIPDQNGTYHCAEIINSLWLHQRAIYLVLV